MTDKTAAEPDTETEVEEEHGHQSGYMVLSLGDLLGTLTEGAEIEMPAEMPTRVRNVLSDVIAQIMAREMAQEVKKWVTAEVANAVLWCYGDFEGTSEPSMADAALINFIRVCAISDDHYLSHLNEIADFHGYIIAVKIFAEKDEQGMRFLRGLAGLEGGEEVPTEAMYGAVAKARAEAATEE
jgi:hypothetical protein